MASICSEGDRRRIVFADVNGKRRTLTLGDVPDGFARMVANHVETLVAAAALGFDLEDVISAEALQTLPYRGHASRDRMIETMAWLRSEQMESIRPRMEAAGLVRSRATERQDMQTVGGFLDAYVARRNDSKRATLIFYGHTVRNLKDFFGADRRIASITVGDAKDFFRYLETIKGERGKNPDRLSAATVARRKSLARTFFQDAVDRELIAKNPFPQVKNGTKGNRERQRFIAAEIIEKVIDACPSAEWRLLVALSRYAGLRVPSEPLLLRWCDIDWAGGKMVIHSPKTEHHEGKGKRICPLFPEILPHLEALHELAPDFDPADPSTAFVFRQLRPKDLPNKGWGATNLRTQFERIILRAGFTPWPRLWHNLRATRQTELTDRFPAHVVAAWLGNSERIATEHYLQVTDAHYAEAVRKPVRAGVSEGVSVRQRANGAHGKQLGNAKTPAKTGVKLGDEGLEPPTSTL